MAPVARFDLRSSDPDDIAPDMQGMNIPIRIRKRLFFLA
jgi:hypothetical protein